MTLPPSLCCCPGRGFCLAYNNGDLSLFGTGAGPAGIAPNQTVLVPPFVSTDPYDLDNFFGITITPKLGSYDAPPYAGTYCKLVGNAGAGEAALGDPSPQLAEVVTINSKDILPAGDIVFYIAWSDVITLVHLGLHAPTIVSLVGEATGKIIPVLTTTPGQLGNPPVLGPGVTANPALPLPYPGGPLPVPAGLRYINDCASFSPAAYVVNVNSAGLLGGLESFHLQATCCPAAQVQVFSAATTAGTYAGIQFNRPTFTPRGFPDQGPYY